MGHIYYSASISTTVLSTTSTVSTTSVASFTFFVLFPQLENIADKTINVITIFFIFS